jgi:cysteine synthase A
MPESMSVERRRILAAYGAELVLTPREKGMPGSIEKAKEIIAATPGAWMPMQFDNPANVEIHRRTTAQEILRDFPEGIDYLITGVGTGGHISAVSEVLKRSMPKLKTFAVEPSKSTVLSGGQHAPHKLQGIGAGFVPGNFDRAVVDGFIQVTEEDAFAYAQRAAREEAVFVGPSSGAALAAVAQKVKQIPGGSVVLTFCYDTGERYLSVEGLFPA